MGCDGGTIPRRDELVRLKKKPEQKDKDSERLYRWRHCALTQKKLEEPIVMCGLGRLYSKQSVIENLLEKKMPAEFEHIKSLKDIKNLKLTANPAYNAEDDKNAKFVCALIGLEMSGSHRFCSLWSCGCVFSERALKELKSNVCSMCQTPYSEQDIVIINGNEEDIESMRTKMEARVARLKAEKKDKSSKIKKEVVETVVSNESSDLSSKFIKPSAKADPSTSKHIKLIANPAKVTAAKRELITDVLGTDPDAKKMKKDYSVQKDEKATEVYKSIFTSHESEQNQERAHWITYNPFYN